MPETLFLIKKIIGASLMPLPLGFLLLLIGGQLYARRHFLISKIIAFGVLLIWYLLSLSPVASLLVEPLENQFPKYTNQAVSYIIVLGGYHHSDERKPISSLLSTVSLMRLTEGIRIYRLNAGAKLLLSGYKGRDKISNAEAMAKVAGALGVPSADIILATNTKDTGEEAQHWAQYLVNESSAMDDQNDKKPIMTALVTSASHMPRALFWFRDYLAKQPKIKIVPAPTAYMTGAKTGLSWRSFVPSANALQVTEAAWHEYLGIIWARLNS